MPTNSQQKGLDGISFGIADGDARSKRSHGIESMRCIDYPACDRTMADSHSARDDVSIILIPWWGNVPADTSEWKIALIALSKCCKVNPVSLDAPHQD